MTTKRDSKYCHIESLADTLLPPSQKTTKYFLISNPLDSIPFQKKLSVYNALVIQPQT